MANLARTSTRPSLPGPKTKILLVRQPVKSVRRTDEPDRTMVHLAIGVIVAVGVITAVWLMGHLGFRAGFASTVRAPELQIDAAGALVFGALMFTTMPLSILEAGIVDPLWMMEAFALIAIPAACLGAVQPRAPGGPRPKTAVVVMSYAGAIFASLNALAALAWTLAPLRTRFIHDLPPDAALVDGWISGLQIAAGLDVLVTIAAALWVVVVMRLAIPPWLRGLSASACFVALTIVVVNMAVTNGAVTGVTMGRSVSVNDEDTSVREVILGFTPQQVVTLHADEGSAFVSLRNRPANLTIVGKQTVVEYLRSQAPAEEF